LLTADERQKLVQAMAEDVLAVLCHHPLLNEVWVVSNNLGVERLAGQYGARYIDERRLGTSGLNNVVQAASVFLQQQGARRLLVVHGDIPLLSDAELNDLLQAGEYAGEPSIILATDRHKSGSNALVLSPPTVLPFQFGENSRQKHCETAAQRGINYQVLQLPGLACDIDCPDDLLALLRHTVGSPLKTTSYLDQINIYGRLITYGSELPRQADGERYTL
jgi:2-phospho-L-lactate guanylyltransferase